MRIPKAKIKAINDEMDRCRSAATIPDGPWEAKLSEDIGMQRGWNVIDLSSDNGDIILTVDPDDILTELGHSNGAIARVASAAPDLIIALEWALDRIEVLEKMQPNTPMLHGPIKDALRKAGVL